MKNVIQENVHAELYIPYNIIQKKIFGVGWGIQFHNHLTNWERDCVFLIGFQICGKITD